MFAEVWTQLPPDFFFSDGGQKIVIAPPPGVEDRRFDQKYSMIKIQRLIMILVQTIRQKWYSRSIKFNSFNNIIINVCKSKY